MEKHKGLLLSVHQDGSRDLRDVQLKQELRSALKTSIYLVCNAFGDHISEVPMAQEHRQKIESFKNFMEG